MTILYGRDHYNEELMGLRFQVGAFSFFQTNVEAVERMFTEALALIPSLDGKTVWDLYSGTGTLAQAVAPSAKEAVGVEISEESVAMARENAIRNNLPNCRFIAGDVLKALDDMTDPPDMIIVDPPRSGIHPKAMKKIVSYGVPHILYISCNPKTLIQNLPEAQEAGYRIEHFRVYDNFPFTRHVETVVLMSKVKK
jgi:tRNA/tmRNA/rRNA uracil-C5-methylase (TrmA/RlmC/RlmD family)